MTLGTLRSDNDDVCSDEIHSCLRTFISNTVRTATILNRDNTRRQCFKQYSRQCVETDQFWSLLRVNCQAANTRSNVSKGKLKNKVTWPLKAGKQTKPGTQPLQRPWKSHWKIDFASFQTISRFSQVALLHKRKERGRRPSSDRDGRIYRLPFPSYKNLKFGHFTS